VAVTSVGLTVIRDAGKAAQLNEPELLQLAVDPVGVYCDLPHPEVVVYVVKALARAEVLAVAQ